MYISVSAGPTGTINPDFAGEPLIRSRAARANGTPRCFGYTRTTEHVICMRVMSYTAVYTVTKTRVFLKTSTLRPVLRYHLKTRVNGPLASISIDPHLCVISSIP